MYNVLAIQINKRHELFSYLDEMSHRANNLYNAALFRERQTISSRNKEVLSQNEIDILKEIEIMNEKLKQLGKEEKTIPSSGVLSYNFLDALMKLNKNVDYFNNVLPMQTSQNVLKNVTQNISSFFKANEKYKENPELFTGKPKFPKYKRKQGRSSFSFTNQDCVIKQNKKGNYIAKLPLTKLKLSLGKNIKGRLKQVDVSCLNNIYCMSFIFEDECLLKEASIPERIASIDLGVDNLMAITNNIGQKCLLYNGKPLKSINQNYNKKIANIVSVNTKNSKYKASNRYSVITRKRNNQIKDYINKTCKNFINWCVENRIDTVVVGSNKFWKQEINIGSVNNQNFTQIPFEYLKRNLKVRCEINGINYVEVEESYTSKASFLDNDDIPKYEEGAKHKFSGKRIKRGLYKSKNKTIINADLNGSANILRKAFPDIEFKPLFNKIISNPKI